MTSGRPGAAATRATTSGADGSGGSGATDRTARITFRLTGGALGLRLLRDAPPASVAARGRQLEVLCGYAGESGLTLIRRPLRWPAGRSTARVPLDPLVLASAEFCALSRGSRDVARVVFQ